MTRKKIKLAMYEQLNDFGGQRRINEKTVWAELSDIGVTSKFSAVTCGKTAELQAVMWRGEYGGQSHVETGGVLYKITESGAADNPLRIKLILERESP